MITLSPTSVRYISHQWSGGRVIMSWSCSFLKPQNSSLAKYQKQTDNFWGRLPLDRLPFHNQNDLFISQITTNLEKPPLSKFRYFLNTQNQSWQKDMLCQLSLILITKYRVRHGSQCFLKKGCIIFALYLISNCFIILFWRFHPWVTTQCHKN